MVLTTLLSTRREEETAKSLSSWRCWLGSFSLKLDVPSDGTRWSYWLQCTRWHKFVSIVFMIFSVPFSTFFYASIIIGWKEEEFRVYQALIEGFDSLVTFWYWTSLVVSLLVIVMCKLLVTFPSVENWMIASARRFKASPPVLLRYSNCVQQHR